ncbi:MAG: hypothetical protein D6809_04605 [Gammaproteobacteria bacterium]|nr:MAG: hypothetical protein D6809_04605 [Gammaproteobacteria bacterium]
MHSMPNPSPAPRRRARALAALLGATLACLAAPQAAWAHAGHAGPLVRFVSTKHALKAMLPRGAKIVRRKQELSEEARRWAKERFGVELPGGLHTFFLARDRASGRVLGGALVREEHYRHGSARVAVGLDDRLRLTGLGLLGVSKKYTIDFEALGKGLFRGFEGLAPEALPERLEARFGHGSLPARKLVGWLKQDAALLAALLHQVEGSR